MAGVWVLARKCREHGSPPSSCSAGPPCSSGPGGGYRLGRPAGRISIADIVRAIETHGEEDRDAAACSNQANIDAMLVGLDERVAEFLDGISLESLTYKHKKQETAYRPGTTASLIARMFPARGGFMPQPAGA